MVLGVLLRTPVMMALSGEGLALDPGSQGITLGRFYKRSRAMSCKSPEFRVQHMLATC